MTKIIIDPYAKGSQLVGIIPSVIPKYYKLQCVSHDVHMPPGVLKHLRKRGHWDDFMAHYQDIPEMISHPDYAGQNPKEPESIELYKVMDDHVLLAIKMNPQNGLFLGSFYILNNGVEKIKRRLRVGRIYPYSFFV